MKICNAMSNIGNDVYLITRGRKNNKSDFDYYGVPSSFKILKLRIFNLKWLSSLFFLFFALWKIFQINPDIIYTRHRFSLIIFPFLYSIPLILEEHDPPKGFYRLLINFLIKKRISKLVLISNELKKLYEKIIPNIINNEKVIIAHDGADPINNLYKESDLIIKNKSKINCGYVGHLYKGRGIGKILKISEKLKDIDFHIIGGNKKDIDYWLLKNTDTNVFFHGYKENSKIPSILNQFDILLAPYQEEVFLANKLNTASWMSPLKVFEYMSSGNAIICSDLLVIKEILNNKVNCLLVKPNDVSAWIKSILLLVDKPELREQLGKKAKFDLENYFTWEKRAKNILYEK